jgi:hypothetical protein
MILHSLGSTDLALGRRGPKCGAHCHIAGRPATLTPMIDRARMMLLHGKPRLTATIACQRRDFLKQCTVFWPAMLLAPRIISSEGTNRVREDWLKMQHDPVRALFSGPPDLDRILGLYPRTTGEPAFDPAEMEKKAQALRIHPAIATGHAFLDRSVRVGLAHIDATFQGDHPKYGVGTYAQPIHDGFPPEASFAA